MYISEESHAFLLSSYLASIPLSRQLELADYSQREESLRKIGKKVGVQDVIAGGGGGRLKWTTRKKACGPLPVQKSLKAHKIEIFWLRFRIL
jgi:hypothetical protein